MTRPDHSCTQIESKRMSTTVPKHLSTTDDGRIAITRLPADAIAQIKSSGTITNLTNVVTGLLENSLDAQATNVEILVDSRRGGCTIEDNGFGILPAEFGEDGGLGHVYHTSKRSGNLQRETHGGDGVFLASLAALSYVTITSRHRGHYSHNTLAMHHARPITRLLPAPVQQHLHGVSSGTRVVMRDLFGNMPVRVKQRAIHAENPAKDEKDWQVLRKAIVSLLLPWRGEITVKVQDIGNASHHFAITCNKLSHSDSAWVEASERSLSAIDRSNIINILAQAKLSSFALKETWIPAFASTGDLSIRGLISTEPAPSRSCQFISIGIMSCTENSDHHALFDTVNHAFNQSSFGVLEQGASKDQEWRDLRYKQDGPTGRQRGSGARSVDRWPRFYIRIDTEEGVQPRRLFSNSDPTSIVEVLDALTHRWLESNHFGPKKRSIKSHPDEAESFSTYGAPNPTRDCSVTRENTVDADKPEVATSHMATATSSKHGRKELHRPYTQRSFTDWSRIKSSRVALYDEMWKCQSQTASSSNCKEVPPSINIQRLTTRESRSASNSPVPDLFQATREDVQLTSKSAICEGEALKSMTSEDVVDWMDPTSKRIIRIDARTGMLAPQIQESFNDDTQASEKAATKRMRLSTHSHPMSFRRLPSAPTDRSPSPWLRNVIDGSDNTVFANQKEQSIPVATYEGPGHEAGGIKRCRTGRDKDNFFAQAGSGSTSRLSKGFLSTAEVISQVDQKFILLKMNLTEHCKEGPAETRAALVMVDQHAASERCILEDLYTDLCQPQSGGRSARSNLGVTSMINTVTLDRGIQYQVCGSEVAMFKANAAHFARCGILYNISDTQTSRGENGMLEVLTIPPGISERCLSQPELLIELLRAELYNDSAHVNTSAKSQAEDDDSPGWLRQIGSCPQGLIQMLKSRACRSAIMFNDPLSMMECRELVRKLSGCAFPFICAHGRVSMVPIVYIDGEGNDDCESVFETYKESRKEKSFADSYKDWVAKRRK